MSLFMFKIMYGKITVCTKYSTYCVYSSFQPHKGIGCCMFVSIVLELMVIQNSVKEHVLKVHTAWPT